VFYTLIDPYIYQHLDKDEIKICNIVAHIIHENNEDLDTDLLRSAIVSTFKPGMHARALQLQVQAKLKIID
jgi:hypothetical protein